MIAEEVAADPKARGVAPQCGTQARPNAAPCAAQLLQLVLDELPSWIRNVRYERTDWLSVALQALWPHLERGISREKHHTGGEAAGHQANAFHEHPPFRERRPWQDRCVLTAYVCVMGRRATLSQSGHGPVDAIDLMPPTIDSR